MNLSSTSQHLSHSLLRALCCCSIVQFLKLFFQVFFLCYSTPMFLGTCSNQAVCITRHLSPVATHDSLQFILNFSEHQWNPNSKGGAARQSSPGNHRGFVLCVMSYYSVDSWLSPLHICLHCCMVCSLSFIVSVFRNSKFYVLHPGCRGKNKWERKTNLCFSDLIVRERMGQNIAVVSIILSYIQKKTHLSSCAML